MSIRGAFSRAATAARLPELAMWLAARSGRVPILMYHSVASGRPEGALRSCLALLGMQVSATTFERHMEILAREYDVTSLSEYLASRDRHRSTTRRAAVITFDDGFVDNLTCAVPVLERNGFHATFFLIGGCVTHGQGPWIYRLYALLDLLDRATVSFSTPRVSLEGLVIDSNAAKMAAIRALRPIAMSGTDAERLMLFDRLADIALQHGRAAAPAERLFMDGTQARALVTRGFGIGGHSMTHACMTELPLEAQREEVRGSAELVRALQGDGIMTFAYPFGSAGSYSTGTRTLLRESGFACALTTRSGLAGPGGSVFELRRLEIGEFGDAEFLATVSGLLSFPKAAARSVLERRRQSSSGAEGL
jgi:peptidoglycan/xylan/chitin deacetylase (PgdA/CDA1 family)